MGGSFENWMLNHFDKSTLKDIADYGCASGFSGLIYYPETIKLYQKYQDDIWEMLTKDAEEMGYDNPIELIATFRARKEIETGYQFENLLIWYAAERVAFRVACQDEY